MTIVSHNRKCDTRRDTERQCDTPAEVFVELHEILVAARIVGKHAALARPPHLFEVLLHALVSLLLDELVPVLLLSLLNNSTKQHKYI